MRSRLPTRVRPQECAFGSRVEHNRMSGETVLGDRYRLGPALARGMCGMVHLATDLDRNTRVVAKALGHAPLEQVRSEVERLAALDDAALARVVALIEGEGRTWLVTEYVPGRTLDDLVAADGPLPELRALSLTRQLCRALHVLHSGQPRFVFRCLDPDNVIVGAGERLTLIDFGIGKFDESGDDTRALPGVLVPGWAAPEQFMGFADVHSDVYSVGAVVYFLLSGHRPAADDPLACVDLRRSRSDVSERTLVVLESMLDVRAARRPRGMLAVLDALGLLDDGATPVPAFVPLRQPAVRQEAVANDEESERAPGVDEAKARGERPLTRREVSTSDPSGSEASGGGEHAAARGKAPAGPSGDASVASGGASVIEGAGPASEPAAWRAETTRRMRRGAGSRPKKDHPQVPQGTRVRAVVAAAACLAVGVLIYSIRPSGPLPAPQPTGPVAASSTTAPARSEEPSDRGGSGRGTAGSNGGAMTDGSMGGTAAQGSGGSADADTASLALRTVPSGARVSIDGSERGYTPLRVSALAPGAHRVVLEHPETTPMEYPITLGSGDHPSVTIVLHPRR